MKKMTCKQLGGACDLEFKANTFEEIAEKSQEHGKEMFAKNDPDHLIAMEEMQKLMQDKEAMQQWFQKKRKEFEEQN